MESTLTFEQWKSTIKEVTVTLIGQPPADINDVPYWDLWIRNINPLKLGTYVSCLHRSTNGILYNSRHLISLMQSLSGRCFISSV